MLIFGIIQWLKRPGNDRMSVEKIFIDMDVGGFKELDQRKFLLALSKIGVALRQNEMALLASVLDPKQTGFLKYGPFVQELNGIRSKEFLHESIEKISEWVRTRDILP